MRGGGRGDGGGACRAVRGFGGGAERVGRGSVVWLRWQAVGRALQRTLIACTTLRIPPFRGSLRLDVRCSVNGIEL